MFKKKTVASVLSTFTKAVEDLKAIVTDKKGENNVIRKELHEKAKIIEGNEEEIREARVVIANISNLIGKGEK